MRAENPFVTEEARIAEEQRQAEIEAE